MKRLVFCAALILGYYQLASGVSVPSTEILRGDANNSGSVSSADATYITNYLFNGGSPPPCIDQADANDDGTVNVSDSSYIYNFIYMGGSAPPAPYPNCG